MLQKYWKRLGNIKKAKSTRCRLVEIKRKLKSAMEESVLSLFFYANQLLCFNVVSQTWLTVKFGLNQQYSFFVAFCNVTAKGVVRYA